MICVKLIIHEKKNLEKPMLIWKAEGIMLEMFFFFVNRVEIITFLTIHNIIVM
jgi:hypothetical protein